MVVPLLSCDILELKFDLVEYFIFEASGLKHVCPISKLVKIRMGGRILNDALRTIVNAERRGMAKAHLQPIATIMTILSQDYERSRVKIN